MRILIVGAGEVGYHIAKQLSEESQDVVLIDKDPKKIRRISENLDIQTLWGSGTSPQLLRDAGIEEADMLVAATLLMSFVGLDVISAISSVATCLGNVGPGLGSVGPTGNFSGVPLGGKWILIICMLLGRLEIYTIPVLLVPGFWRK